MFFDFNPFDIMPTGVAFLLFCTIDICFLARLFRLVSTTGYVGCLECGDSDIGNFCGESLTSGTGAPALERVPYR
jgi:hypothetical protein